MYYESKNELRIYEHKISSDIQTFKDERECDLTETVRVKQQVQKC